ncbi:MAG: 4-hydroxy-tetrahydrodipicolinate synthase [Vampirovibrionales bacterium]
MISLKALSLIPAMVTPFNAEGALDVDALRSLAVYLIQQQHNDALLVNGTTGESPTTSTDEKLSIIRHVKEALNQAGCVRPIIAGAGTNNTATTAQLAQASVQAGADALLIVVPYYNKPSQAGMLAHFGVVAQAVPNTPIIIYNIPGRTGVLMLPETMASLHAQYPNIVGVKQSHGDMEAVGTIGRLLPPSFIVWSGDDPLTLPMMTNGATGVISVLSHVAGPTIAQMMAAYQQGDVAKAQGLHQQLLPIGQQLFTLPNPTIIKSLLAHQGVIPSAVFRLPLVPIQPDEERLLTNVVAALQTIR